MRNETTPGPAQLKTSGLLRDTQGEEQLKAFLEHAAEGIHWVGPDGTILWANRAELDMLGYSREEYIGRHIAEFHVDPPVIDDILRRLGCDETLNAYEARMRCKDGTIRHVEINSNVLWQNGRFVQTRCFTRDITDRKLAEEASQRFHAIVESSGDAIVTQDLEGRVTLWNSAAERTFGFAAAQMMGQPFRRVIPPDLHSEDDSIINRVRQGERVQRLETERQTSDGSRISVAVTISPICDAKGTIVGASRIIRDISEIKAAERQLKRAFEAAQAADRRKDEFLALLGHELRNPLAPIVTGLELLRTRKDAPSTEELDRLERHVHHLASLVDDLLDVSRITQGKLALSPEFTEVSTLVERAVDLTSSQMREAGHQFAVRVSQAGLVVHGDALRLSQVFCNLLSNAAKFTPRGGLITVVAEGRGETVEITVTDTGIGIEPEKLELIFEPFEQGNPDVPQGGLGLGLTLARQLVEMHGGSISASSQGIARGSIFAVTLPLAAAPNTRPSARNGIRKLPMAANRRRILVVDDNADAADTMADLLRLAGHEVVAAYNGPEGLRRAEQSRPDVAVLDLGLPGMDGYELCRLLREKLGPPVQLIAVSGFGQSRDLEQSRESGFARHFAKPVRIEDLLAAIDG